MRVRTGISMPRQRSGSRVYCLDSKVGGASKGGPAGVLSRPPAHVVVCDAAASSAESLTRAFRAAGFRVTTCATAAACEEVVASDTPALVTVPVILPDQDGFALIRRLCAQRDAVARAARSLQTPRNAGAGRARPRVVMVSALQAEHRARAAGADAFLAKPAQDAELVSLASALIGPARGGRRGPAPDATRGQAAAPTRAATASLSDVIARTARAVAAVEQPDEALTAVLAAARTYLGASGAALLRSEVGRLVPAGSAGLETTERGADETALVPESGGGYPIVLAGWLEGVLLLTGVTPSTLAEQEASLSPLLDLSAAALRNSRLLADLRSRRQEREASSFARLSNTVSASATASSFGITPLRQAAAELFDDFTRRYGELMDLALDQRGFRIDHGLPAALRRLAHELGLVGATPRDVIEMHTMASRLKTAGTPSRKTQAFLEEGNLMVLELMGYLASFYRGRAAPAWLYQREREASEVQSAQ